MSAVILRWIGDLDRDKREQTGCVSSSSDQFRPKKIELKTGQQEIRIGRNNTKSPPDYPIESCINSRMISRNHAIIQRTSQGLVLFDHSMNGTYVNYTRAMGGMILKHGDVVCFGHLNGANLKPGDPVPLYYSDLKYRVELKDFSPTGESNSNAAKKRRSYPVHTGSTVSSTQLSDGDDDRSLSSGEDFNDLKRPRLSGNSAKNANRQKFKKPSTGLARTKTDEEDENSDFDDDDDDDDLDGASGAKRMSSSGMKGLKKKSNGMEKIKKFNSTNLLPRKSSGLKLGHGHKDKRGRSSKTGKLYGDRIGGDTGGEMFHYDSEECSARPCKQPQDIAIDWIQCDRCTLWYHQVCVGLKPSEANVDTYYCPYCKK